MWSASGISSWPITFPTNYINDICNCTNQVSFILFAGDTNIFYKTKLLKDLTQTVNYKLFQNNPFGLKQTITEHQKSQIHVTFQQNENPVGCN